MTLGLANGAQWNTDENSFVNKLNFNDGIINVNGGEGQEVKHVSEVPLFCHCSALSPG